MSINFGPHGRPLRTSSRQLKDTRKRIHSNSTPGSTKGENCQASVMDRFFAKYSRAYKHPGYYDWCLRHRG